ncbi:MAG TPA: hypothetical protein VM307_05975, partial [Egibacteraceae bacterium]|nr:hypothetical protein [Egibacteraceae bacterium]
SWTNGARTADVAVRMLAGTTAPATPSAGTAVGSGLRTSAAAKGLKAGTDYAFSVFALGDDGAASAARSVVVRGTKLTAKTAKAINHGGKVKVTGTLTRATSGAKIAGATVKLLQRPGKGTAWKTVATGKTSAKGVVTLTHVARRNGQYALRFGGAGTDVGVTSPVRTVKVRQVVTATLSKSRVAPGTEVTVSGSVTPASKGHTVKLQQRTKKGWKEIASQKLAKKGTFAFTVKPAAKGSYEYRVNSPATKTHAAATSPARTLKVA